MKSRAYFDYAAATPLLPEALTAMQPYLTDIFYNPSALYLSAQAVKHAIQAARSTVGAALGARQNEIIFTAGGTEANNLAITGMMQQYSDAHIVTTAIEHDSVLKPAQGYENTIVSVDAQGRVSVTALVDAITEKTVLVSVILANNEIGTIQDIKDVTAAIEEIKIQRHKVGNTRPLYVHTDACQAVNYVDINTARLGVDLMTINAGKVYGPKQTGALFVKSGVQLQPLILGGGQEKNLRSGTQNVANIIGFAKAIETVRHDASQEIRRLEKLQKHIADNIIDGTSIHMNGPKIGRRLVNNIHITVDGYDNERLLMELDERGIQIATGSACSASNDEPSHVLAAIGLNEQRSRNSVRISSGRFTTIEQCDLLIQSIKEVVAKH